MKILRLIADAYALILVLICLAALGLLIWIELT
jgi:hypothetical protein